MKTNFFDADNVLTRISLFFSAFVAAAVLPCLAATTNIVTTTNDSGAGSLRTAINNANGGSGTNLIQFNIPPFDGTVKTITLASQLPTITHPMIIDGYTQTNSSPNTKTNGDDAMLLIEINGGGMNASGLLLGTGSSGSTVRGLVINSFNGFGCLLFQSRTNAVEGCFLGTDPTGGIARNALGTAVAIEFGDASFTRIGGTTPAARNIISGNSTAINIVNGSNCVVQGNFFGLDSTGTNALPNAQGFIVQSIGNLIGGTTAAGRNIVVGGISISGSAATGNRIQGNFIGTDVNGAKALGSFVTAIDLPSSSATQIGGLASTPGTPPGNLIVGASGNNGIFLQTSDNNVIQGNLIGTDATGTKALSRASRGIPLQGSSNLIGGPSVGARNVISGHNGIGIQIAPGAGGCSGNLIQGNFIGTDITGTNLLGNATDGVEIQHNGFFAGDPFNNTIQSNVIAGNGSIGVNIITGTNNAVLGNSIFANGGLGIDLLGNGVTTNDVGDIDDGPNHLQNFPVISGVSLGGGNVTLSGTLNSSNNAFYRFEFFSNPSCDKSGYGQGQTFLGFTNVTTDGSGNAAFVATFPNGSDSTFTATATDTNGSTSEFSACAFVSGPCAFTGPANMVVSTAPNQCGAVVYYVPTTSGNCGAVSNFPASGTFFAKGTNLVTCTTSSGTNYTFTITVNDTVAPAISCPSGIVTNVPAGQTNAVVDYSAQVVFSDNCALATTNCSPPSGSPFPLGVTTVTCTATDTSGNSNFCSFTVTVEHTNMPPVAQCHDVTTNANANASCQADVPATAVDNGSFDSDGTITNRTLSPPGPYSKGTNAVTLTVVDNQGASNSCTAKIIVQDTTRPNITCPANIVTNLPANLTNAVVNYPAPVVTDNCGVTSTNCSPASGSTFHSGVTTVTCTATDTSGNTTNCSFTVTVITNALPVAQCRNVTTNASASCQAAVDPTAVDNGSFDPDGTIVSRILNPPGPYATGTNAVTLTVVDDRGGSNSCAASIIVQDTTPPSFTFCAANIVTNAPPGQFGVVVTYPAPVVTDICGVASTNCSPASGTNFSPGVTTVTCTATDTSGNSTNCSFTVTVNLAADHFWTNALGGDYNVFTNWLGHLIPGVVDNANFTNNASYQVAWTGVGDVAANAFFNAGSGIVTQAIGSQFWQLTNSYVVGQNAGSTAAVTHLSGTLLVTNPAGTGLLVISQAGKAAYNLDGGAVVADTLLATNNGAGFTNSTFNFDFGTLTTLNGSVITPTANFLIGTVVGQTATWNMLGGANTFGASPGSAALGGPTGTRGALLVSGPNTLWTNIQLLYVGSNGSLSTLTISNGARLAAVSVIVGSASGSTNNVLAVEGSNSFLGLSGAMTVGNSGSSNQLLISNGGVVSNFSAGAVGNNVGHGNLVQVSGPGSAWLNAGTLNIGSLGASNLLVIDTGGSVRSPGAVLGGALGANANSALVTGVGSLWTDTGDLTVGDSIGNSLTISNGGQLHGFTSVLGGAGVSSNNFAIVTGAGSVWSNSASLEVGQLGAASSLIVSNGGAVIAPSAIIGSQPGTSNNVLSVAGGTLEVTNASATAALDIRRGTNLLNSGVVETDRLLVTNALGRFAFNGGTLLTKSTTNSNGLTFIVGDGSSPATLTLVGNGIHNFVNGLTVRSNATLGGNGTILGALTVQNRGTLSPGASVGKLAFSNSPVLLGSVLLEISKKGAALTNDQVQVAGPLTYGGALTVTNIGPTALVAGDRFPLFSASSFAGSFTSITLPPLNNGLGWTNKFLVDGSIQVLGFPVPQFSSLSLSGANLVISGTNGPTNGTYRVLASTNVVLPVTNWTALLTNQFDGNGNFVFTNAINPGVPIRFYRLLVP
jgi:T5SS/PEP-CTERM-associated repeat protein